MIFVNVTFLSPDTPGSPGQSIQLTFCHNGGSLPHATILTIIPFLFMLLVAHCHLHILFSTPSPFHLISLSNSALSRTAFHYGPQSQGPVIVHRTLPPSLRIFLFITTTLQSFTLGLSPETDTGQKRKHSARRHSPRPRTQDTPHCIIHSLTNKPKTASPHPT